MPAFQDQEPRMVRGSRDGKTFGFRIESATGRPVQGPISPLAVLLGAPYGSTSRKTAGPRMRQTWSCKMTWT